MNSEQLPQQPFEALCKIASCERWCWKMVCTTCGHMLFRYGLRQLALGADPNNSSWVVHSDHPVLRRGVQLRELGPVPPLSGWPVEEQRSLISTLRAADIRAIASNTSFPDWLGYLGLALRYTEDAEAECRELTRIWAPQLASLVQPESPVWHLMTNLAANESCTLKWRHLESLELDVAR